MILTLRKIFFNLTYLFTLSLFVISCSSDDNGPDYDTNLIIQSTETNIQTTFTSLNISGKLLSDNGIISKGICWSKNPKPTTSSNKITESSTTFTTLIEDLNPNTTYYFRIFATTSSETTYSQEKSFSTLGLGETYWQFSIINHNGTEILAKVNFYENGTTKYVQDNCPTCYVPTGSWMTNNNDLTYIGQNDDPSLSTHVFYGNVTGMTLQGTYQNLSNPDGTWTATLLP